MTEPTGACKACGTRNVGVFDQCVGCGARLDMSGTSPDATGLVVGGYQLKEQLGRGAMGCVYAAQDGAAGDGIALKLLHPHLAADPLRVKRFRREAKAAKSLSHPSIIRLIEFGDDETYGPFIVMERLHGENLLHKSTRVGLSFKEICEVFAQVLSALAHAHEHGIVHRDLKAENVVIHRTSEGLVAKVCDFGMVKMVHEEGTAITAEGLVCGTPEYMSPEQARGDELDGRSDIYAIGCLLFLVLTGRLPFRGTNAVETLGHHLARPVPSARRVSPERKIPVSLNEIAQVAMQKSPSDRYQSAAEMRAAILHAAGRLDEGDAPKRRQHGRILAVLLIAFALVAWALTRH